MAFGVEYISSWLRIPVQRFDCSSLFIPATIIVFAACFVTPLALTLRWAGVLPSSAPASWTDVPASADISAAGTFLKIPGSTDLSPSEGKDFLLAGWFKLNRLPGPGQRLTLFSRFETVDDSAGRGFAFAFRREGQNLRPLVYWGAGKRAGKWYEFPDTRIAPKGWFMVGLSLHGGRYLGAYLGIDGVAEPQVLGGYDMGAESEIDLGEADLIAGAFGDRPFRGSIGPLMVLVKRALNEQFTDALSSFFASPRDVPPGVPDKNIRLFLVEQEDRSQFKRRFEVVREER